MTFQQLQYLLEVHKAGSFSTAAKNLYVSQAAVSNAIGALEKEVGEPLFVRGNRTLFLTARGEEVIDHATHIFERFRAITNPKKSQKSAIRIGSVGYAPANRAFLRLLNEYRSRNDLELSFVDSRKGSFFPKLLGKELDIAILFNLNTYSTHLEDKLNKAGLPYQLLTTVPTVVCIGPGHALYHREQIDMAAFRNERLLDTEKDGFASIGVMPAYLPVNRNNILVACGKDVRQEILMQGHAYSIQYMPSKAHRSTSPMRYIPIEGLHYGIYAVFPQGKHCPEADRFLELLKEEIAIEMQ